MMAPVAEQIDVGDAALRGMIGRPRDRTFGIVTFMLALVVWAAIALRTPRQIFRTALLRMAGSIIPTTAKHTALAQNSSPAM